MDGRTEGWTDRGSTVCPFHHSSNRGGIKITKNKLLGLLYSSVCSSSTAVSALEQSALNSEKSVKRSILKGKNFLYSVF